MNWGIRMQNKLYDKLLQLNVSKVGKTLFYAQIVFMIVFTYAIWYYAPRIAYFQNADKDIIWFGDGWSYVNQEGEPIAVNEHYLKLQKTEESVAITKTLDDNVLDDKLLCFRVRAKEVYIYVNDVLWDEKVFPENRRAYGSSVYMFYQIPVKDLHPGDKITMEFTHSDTGNFVVQFLSLGNRYSIVSYVISKCGIVVAIVGFSLLLVLLTILIYYSAVMLGRIEGYKSLWWLIGFLMIGLAYLLTDCGILELWLHKSVVLYWTNAMSFMIMPIPLLIYIKRTFFPDSKRYDVLIALNHVLIIGCVIEFITRAFDLMEAFVYVYVIILVAVVSGLVGFVVGKKKTEKAVMLGSVVIFIATLVGLIAYLRGDSMGVSKLFGTALFLFSLCMLASTVSSRARISKEKDKAMMEILAREKEAAESANEQKTRFLSHMSHEIRTPLNAVLGMNELIMRETKDENVRKYSYNIQSAGKTLLGLINDVLDFSKIDTGKMEIVEAEYSVSSMIHDVVSMMRDKIQDKGLELRIDVNSEIPDCLFGDEIRVKQVLINLLTNAAKYTERGWVQIKIWHKEIVDSEIQSMDEENERKWIQLFMEVQDSGIGIKEEELPRLFHDFERLDQLKNRSIEGSGLGLNITAGLVRIMNGNIYVDSEYGKGSRFWVDMPQKVICSTPIGDYNSRIRQAEPSLDGDCLDIMVFSGKKVLTVDDNEMNLEVISAILEMMELDVYRASSGGEALGMIEVEKYDIIITDDMMPGMSGTELMQIVKGRTEGVNASTPMIVLTANAISGVVDEYISKGFQGYLSKPIDIEQLQKILKKYLDE